MFINLKKLITKLSLYALIASRDIEKYNKFGTIVGGVIFLRTPNRGSQMSYLARIHTLFTYWNGSRTDLLELFHVNSDLNRKVHESYLIPVQSFSIATFMKPNPSAFGDFLPGW